MAPQKRAAEPSIDTSEEPSTSKSSSQPSRKRIRVDDEPVNKSTADVGSKGIETAKESRAQGEADDPDKKKTRRSQKKKKESNLERETAGKDVAQASTKQSTAPTASTSKTDTLAAKKAKTASIASKVTPVVPTTTKPSSILPPAPPSKQMKQVPGTLRRLTKSRDSTSLARPKSTLAGAKVGGRSKDLKDGVTVEEIWVKQRVGMGLGGYIKRGVSAFRDRGCTSLWIHGMTAAIPLATTLALAIRDALPGGSSDPNTSTVQMRITTGSNEVADEITPDDEDEDLIYQTRVKSTVAIELSIREAMASAGLRLDPSNGSRRGGTGANTRGKKRRGGGLSGSRGR